MEFDGNEGYNHIERARFYLWKCCTTKMGHQPPHVAQNGQSQACAVTSAASEQIQSSTTPMRWKVAFWRPVASNHSNKTSTRGGKKQARFFAVKRAENKEIIVSCPIYLVVLAALVNT